jgi:hypothetical protein
MAEDFRRDACLGPGAGSTSNSSGGKAREVFRARDRGVAHVYVIIFVVDLEHLGQQWL